MENLKIEKLENLITLPIGHKIIKYNVENLTQAGDNYGSLMTKLDVVVETLNESKTLNYVAKLVPPSEFVQELFNTQVTYRNEIGFYKKIVPVLQQLQIDHDVTDVVNFAPKYFGSRLNLENDDTAKVDSNAALILENLKVSGYVNTDRTIGHDFETAKLVLGELAGLHAVPVALKIHKPDVFAQEIRPYLVAWTLDAKNHEKMRATIRKHIEDLDDVKTYTERAITAFNNIIKPVKTREPWGTISHNDCWVNNTMIKFHDGIPVDGKLVDYQTFDYGSPARDLVFYLFSSVDTNVVQKQYDDLLHWYHQKFINILKKLDCDVSQFSYRSLEGEMSYEAKNSQLGHILFMLYGIFATKHEAEKGLREDGDNIPPNEQHIDKLTFVLREFDKRNWM